MLISMEVLFIMCSLGSVGMMIKMKKYLAVGVMMALVIGVLGLIHSQSTDAETINPIKPVKYTLTLQDCGKVC